MTFLEAFLLVTPALVANMAPVLAARYGVLARWAIPIENSSQCVKGMIGANKTWRGIIAAVGAGGVVGILLTYFGVAEEVLSGPLIGGAYGMYAGFLAILGDLLESVIKRRVGVPSGKPFLPWDQIDYMILFLIGTYVLFQWPLVTMGFLLGLAFFGNLITNYVAFKCGIKSTPW